MSQRRYGGSVYRLIDNWFPLVVALLVLFILLGSWATYITYSAAAQSVDGSTEFQHGATVQEENPIYSNGTELSNETTYFTSITPELEGEFAATYKTNSVDEVTIETDIWLLVRWIPIDDAASDQDEYWRSLYQLEETTETVSSGETDRVEFTVDVAQERDRLESYNEDHGWVPGQPELTVIARTDVTDPNTDDSTLESDQNNMTITLTDDIYTVEDGGPTGLATLVTPGAVNTAQLFGSIAFTVASFVALVGLVIARYHGSLAPSESKASQSDFEYDWKTFEEWISQGSVPDNQLDGTAVHIASLEDLVDVAIDSNRRVLADPERQSFYVLIGETYYEYTPERHTDETDDRELSERVEQPSEANDGQSPN
ncbi:DUF5305 domain-containing protein [Natronococcus occultus]|uniref:DUF5305 domain-containing protein n=1 Tax=Natronococcus occultus SP4 TaxID=694430 RepID=L0K1V8_9EURY|nr:DUF5305 domain-containing protein [Natronococcus occultus]AGB39277.1 hypothetical protein Natoc_3554 [Natronococcus occultus SP4]